MKCDASKFNYKCPYTDDPCLDLQCDECPAERYERETMEGLDDSEEMEIKAIHVTKEVRTAEVISDAIIAQEALSFSRGFDAGYHDGYLACGEKYLECIEEIKAEIPKEAFGHWKPDDVVRVDSVIKIIDQKVGGSSMTREDYKVVNKEVIKVLKEIRDAVDSLDRTSYPAGERVSVYEVKDIIDEKIEGLENEHTRQD